MKKPNLDPKYVKIALYAFATIAISMILWQLLMSLDNLWSALITAIKFIWKAISTVVAGLIIGYVLSPAVEAIEKFLQKIFKKRNGKKAKKVYKGISLALIYILVIACIAAVIYFVIPGLVENIVELVEDVPDYVQDIVRWYEINLKDSSFINSEYVQDIFVNAEKSLVEQANNITISIVTGIASSIFSIVTTVFNVLIALAISFYYLYSKKELKTNIIEFADVKYGKAKTMSARSFLKSVDWVFGKYISAKIIQSILIFILAQIVFLILRVELSTLMSLIVGFSNMIPYIGPIIGTIPPVLITLLEDPVRALWVLIALIALQAVDAYVIEPIFIGDKLGLSAFWVIVVVLIGGNLFGFVGIVLSVPVAAVIRILILQYIKRRNYNNEKESEIK